MQYNFLKELIKQHLGQHQKCRPPLRNYVLLKKYMKIRVEIEFMNKLNNVLG